MFFEHLPKRTALWLWSILIGAMVIVALVTTAYAFLTAPVADDYCIADGGGALASFYSAAVARYHDWDGRWFAHTISYFAFPRMGITSTNYNIILALLPLLWTASFYCFIEIIFRNSARPSQKLFLSLLISCVYWTGISEPGETWYWLTGELYYTLPFLLSALSLLVLTSNWMTAGDSARRGAAFILGTVLAVLVTGIQELVGLFLLGALMIAVGLAAIRRRFALAGLYGLAFLITAAGLAFNLTAPGNAVRAASDFPNRYDIVGGVVTTFFDPDRSPAHWLRDFRLVILTLLLLTSPWLAGARPAWLSWPLPGPKIVVRWAVVVPLVALAAVHLGVFAVAFAQGTTVPWRVLHIVFAVFIVGWLATVATLAPLAQANLAQPNALTRGIHLAAAIALPLALLTAPNTLNAIVGLPRIMHQWRPAMTARDAFIRTSIAEGKRDIVLEPVGARPVMLSWLEQPTNPTHWRNTCMAAFYGARSVALRPGAPRPDAR